MVTSLLAIAFAPEPGRRTSAAQQALAVLRVEGWAPTGARVRFLDAPCAWWGATEAIAEAARGADAVVLFGAADGAEAVAPRYARNEADPARVDVDGRRWPGAVLAPGGPSVLATSLPAAGLARALSFAGLPAEAPAQACRFVPNRCLFALGQKLPALTAGLVLLPLSLEARRQEGRTGGPNRLEILAGVRAALTYAAAFVELRRAA